VRKEPGRGKGGALLVAGAPGALYEKTLREEDALSERKGDTSH